MTYGTPNKPSWPAHKYMAACELRLGNLIYTVNGIKAVQQLTQWDNGTITITWHGGTTTVNPNDPISIKN